VSKNISRLSGKHPGSLFNKLVDAKQSDKELAQQYNLGASTLPGTRSFYDLLKSDPPEAFICSGSACLCRGGQDLIKVELEKHFKRVGEMKCLGRCYENKAFHLRSNNQSENNGRNYSGSDIDQLASLIDQRQHFSAIRSANYTQKSYASNVFLIEDQLIPDIAGFKSAVSHLFRESNEQQLTDLEISGLRGRGGAGFPTALKWKSCAEQKHKQKYVICNADEGDPGAFSDRYLMEEQALKVIFGMLFCAKIIGSSKGFIYIRGEYPEAIVAIKQSIQALEKEKLLGVNILHSNIDFSIEIVVGQGAYICGEETALIASIEGRRAEVDVRPPFPTVEGLYKKPTIVNNVETFAAAAAIFQSDSQNFYAMGNGQSTGTKLICLDGLFNKPGVYEVDMSTPVKEIINDIGGGFLVAVKAVQIGGPLGGIVPTRLLDKLTLDHEAFASAGFLLGHASFVCIPENFSCLDYAKHLFDFVADESCGKCFPCRLGSQRGSEMLCDKKYDAELLNDLLDTMEQGSLCALGGGLPLAIKNLIEYFPDEFSAKSANGIKVHNITEVADASEFNSALDERKI